MTGLLSQFAVVDEVTYGTVVTPTRFYEVNNPVVILPVVGRTTASALRSGSRAPRSAMFAPYVEGATASVEMPVPTIGWGWWLKHMLGAVSSSGAVDSNYTHTGVLGSLTGDFFTGQTALPFSSGTLEGFTGEGGKVVKWELSCDVDGHLTFMADLDFEAVNTSSGGGTAIATPSYPAGATVFSWTGGAITFDAGSIELKDFSVSCTNPLNTGRRFLRGSALKKEPLEQGVRDNITFTASAEFNAMTFYNKWIAATPAGTLAAIVATFTGPIAHAGTTLPQLVITIPVGRIDDAAPSSSGADMIMQNYSGIAMDNASAQPITITYRTTDVTP